jgi:GT2 family glycosyltransferase
MFCLLFKSEIYDTIGELDVQFSPGNFEDDDYCLRAIEEGFKIGCAEDVFIHHFGSVSFGQNSAKLSELLMTNKKKFDIKWSKERYIKLMEKNNG